jgi:hypothetical protein
MHCFVEASVTADAGISVTPVAGLEIVLRTGTLLRFREAACAAQ